MTSLVTTPAAVGGLLREWRQRRRFSQLDLASEAEVSTRHLSFVETGRAAPSRDMLLRLAERLDVPLRARNELLQAGGFAAIYAERPLHAPEMIVARRTVEAVLAAHAPFPALAIDRHWTLVTANAANHVDIPGQERLEAELLAHGATCVLVSHDRSFMSTVGTRFLLIEGGHAREVSDVTHMTG